MSRIVVSTTKFLIVFWTKNVLDDGLISWGKWLNHSSVWSIVNWNMQSLKNSDIKSLLLVPCDCYNYAVCE